MSEEYTQEETVDTDREGINEDTQPNPDADVKDTPLRPEGERALERVKAERAELKTKLAEFEKREKEAEDAKLSETERLQNSLNDYRTRAESAEQRLTRLEVATKYGLTEAQSRRLVGNTAEELDTDAQELLEVLGRPSAPADALEQRPKAKLKGGMIPENDEEDIDPAAVAKKLYSSRFSF